MIKKGDKIIFLLIICLLALIIAVTVGKKSTVGYAVHKDECNITCFNDAGCDDSDECTKEWCENPGTCLSECVYARIIGCGNNSDD